MKKATKTLASMIEEEQLRLKAKQLDLQAFKETCNRSVVGTGILLSHMCLDIELVVSGAFIKCNEIIRVILFNTHSKSRSKKIYNRL